MEHFLIAISFIKLQHVTVIIGHIVRCSHLCLNISVADTIPAPSWRIHEILFRYPNFSSRTRSGHDRIFDNCCAYCDYWNCRIFFLWANTTPSNGRYFSGVIWQKGGLRYYRGPRYGRRGDNQCGQAEKHERLQIGYGPVVIRWRGDHPAHNLKRFKKVHSDHDCSRRKGI